jgi:hypothetical protein
MSGDSGNDVVLHRRPRAPARLPAAADGSGVDRWGYREDESAGAPLAFHRS